MDAQNSKVVEDKIIEKEYDILYDVQINKVVGEEIIYKTQYNAQIDEVIVDKNIILKKDLARDANLTELNEFPC